ncbi:ethylbenzene dehydrogenase-related protein [Halobacterium hubeiense]|uniref:ethylbenzene dehydrogenase-related protein n=1 Tax=Halobacterium hubeiense TaxID=1407499 RepID=UPI003C70C860
MPDDARKLAVAALLVFGMAVAPALVSARPANEIPVEEVGGDADLSAPTADAWSDVAPVRVPLSSAPSGVVDAGDTSVSAARVQVAHDEASLYVRLRWPDGSADGNVSGPRGFADAAAVQLPANASDNPAIAMGSPRAPVNVWYWNAEAGSEELLAGGPGSTTEFADPAVQTRTARENGSYALVFERSLAAGAQNRTNVTLARDVDVAFAVWNGSNMERSGRKAVSEWYHLPLGPQPSGPPYQSILWAVAGLAIVAVLAITVVAVRRADDE